MDNWPEAWGEQPRRVVIPYGWPPSLFLRQAGSALYVGALTHWQAQAALAAFPEGEARRLLGGLAGYVVERRR